jgi:23S rRNA-/tRNA-specific pseudouridylate synthase
MDRARGPSSSPAYQSMGELPCTEADPWQPASKPQTILDLPDRLVIFKPSGWEVYDQRSKLQLASFLQATLGKSFAILRDEGNQCGFLHRLDLPSSGLILFCQDL